MQDKFKDWPLVNMQAQEVFDTAAEHLLTQMKKSFLGGITDFNGCVYRSPEGLKCAAGPFIPDSVYNDSFEQNSWGSLVILDRVPKVHKELISHLQLIHDVSEPEQWYKKLEDFAEKNQFDKTKLQKYQQVQS